MGVKKTYSLVLGIVLGVVGIWGLFSNMLLGVFGVNILQSILHLIAAAFGIYCGTKSNGKMYVMVIGWIGLALGILGFIPGVNDLFLSLLNINLATTVLHLVIGVVSLGVYYLVKE